MLLKDLEDEQKNGEKAGSSSFLDSTQKFEEV